MARLARVAARMRALAAHIALYLHQPMLGNRRAILRAFYAALQLVQRHEALLCAALCTHPLLLARHAVAVESLAPLYEAIAVALSDKKKLSLIHI